MHTKSKLLFITILIILSGCSTNRYHYLYYANKPSVIYEDAALTKELITVPEGHFILAEAKNPQGKVEYGTIKGFANLKALKTRTSISEKDLKSLHFSADSMYTFFYYPPKATDTTYKSSDTSRHIGDRSTPFTTPSAGGYKPVSVKGYYRKDGTYVRPHTRSAPRRR